MWLVGEKNIWMFIQPCDSDMASKLGQSSIFKATRLNKHQNVFLIHPSFLKHNHYQSHKILWIESTKHRRTKRKLLFVGCFYLTKKLRIGGGCTLSVIEAETFVEWGFWKSCSTFFNCPCFSSLVFKLPALVSPFLTFLSEFQSLDKSNSLPSIFVYRPWKSTRTGGWLDTELEENGNPWHRGDKHRWAWRNWRSTWQGGTNKRMAYTQSRQSF